MSSHPSPGEYDGLTLRESDVDPDPIRQFTKWFEEAITIGVIEPHSMALAPSCRRASSSTTSQPTLCRLPAYSRPGLPRPATRRSYEVP